MPNTTTADEAERGHSMNRDTTHDGVSRLEAAGYIAALLLGLIGSLITPAPWF